MANIKLKLGSLELECEGPEEFLKTEVPKFLKLAVDTCGQIPVTTAAPAAVRTPHANGNGSATKIDMAVNTIATRLNVSSGSDLTLAACTSLGLGKNLPTFNRQQIHDEMKAATNFYKGSHRTNLTPQLQKLVSDQKLIERTEGNFDLTSATVTEMEGRLGSN